MNPNPTLRSFLLLAGSSLLAVSSAHAADGTWDTNSGGDWTDVTKWLGDTAHASGADFTATFGNFITADSAINLDAAITIGNITASDTTHNYTISGANILTLERTDSTKPSINVTTSTRALTISSVIAGNDGLQKTGAGTLIFTSTSNNTFSGGFDINGGTVRVDNTTNANAFGASSNVITFTGNGTIHNNNNTYTIGQAVAVNNGVIATFRGANAENTIVNGIVSGSGEIQITSDSSTMSASFANTANTHTGKLWVGTSGNALTFTANSLADSSTGSLKMGSATGANQTISFTLGTSTNAPVTLTNRALELAGTTGSTTLGNDATLAANAFTITPNLTFTTASSGNKTLTLAGSNAGANAFNGSIGNNGSSTTAITKAGTGVWTLGNAANDFTGLITVSAGTLNYASAGGANGITFSNTTGSATLSYSGSTDKTMSGAINANAVTSGTVTLGSNGGGAINYSNTGSLGTATSNTVRKLILSGTNTGNNILAGQWVNNTGTSNAATLTKNGTGTWVLSGTNTYTGATAVNAGTLTVSGSGSINNTSAINVAASGTLRYNSSTALTVAPTLNGSGTSNRAILGGTGPINASVTLNNLGDVLSPGNSPGIQNYTVGQSWSAFSYDWEVNNFTGTTAGTDFDQIGITGGLSLSGGSGSYILNVLGLTAGDVAGLTPNFSEVDRSWIILTTSTGITSFNAANWTLNTAGFSSPDTGTWALAQSGNNLVLSYTAVPEPRAALLGGLGMLMLLRRRRR